MSSSSARQGRHVGRPGRFPLAPLVALVCSLCTAMPVAAQEPPPQAAGAWGSLRVPGGASALLEAAGLEGARPRSTTLLDIISAIHAPKDASSPTDNGRQERVTAYLKSISERPGSRQTTGAPAAAAGQPAPEEEVVPLPLPPAVWPLPRGVRPGSSPSVATILGDRRMSLLYYGTCAMDEETRGYLASNPALVKQIYETDAIGPVALYGRSLRVRQGRIETPGGVAAVAAWEALAAERATRPDRFILAVLGKDAGRLALLYDAVAHMEPSQQAFVLGLWLDPPARATRVAALYEAWRVALTGWDARVRPFARGLYDPAHLLLLTGVSPDGRPGPLFWRKLWQRVFATTILPVLPERELVDLEQDGLLDAAGVLQTILPVNIPVRREAAETWLFGQRVFGNAPRNSLPDVLLALRGRTRFVSLAATLERLDVTDPAVYRAAFVTAQRIATMDDANRADGALALYQGGLALVERARLGRTIDAAAASRLVDSLARVPLSDEGEYLGKVAGWIETEYLPAIGSGTGGPPGDGAIEARVLAAFAGGRAGGAATPARTFEHEGSTYALDPSAAEIARLRAVREKQGGASLDAVMAFAREVDRIAGGVRDQARVLDHLAALRTAAAPLLESAADNGARGEVLRDTVVNALAALSTIRSARDLSRIDRAVVSLRRAVDGALGRVLISLAYAWCIGDPESTILVAGDPSLKHTWGSAQAFEAVRERNQWAIPGETNDGGQWQVRGSVVALDVGLGKEALRRVSTDALAGAPTITDNTRRAMTEAVVLADPFDYRDEDMALIAGALRRGRARIAGLASDPSLLPAVAGAAGVDDLRRQLVGWALVHEPERVAGFFSVGEVARLGGLEAGSLLAPDAWGTSGLSFDGRLRLRYPARQPFAALTGRMGKGLLATLVPDLALLVAEALDDQHLPAAVTRAVISAATLDCIERLHPAFEDDWMTLVSDLQRVVPPRMDDYVASATAGGPLVPVSKEP